MEKVAQKGLKTIEKGDGRQRATNLTAESSEACLDDGEELPAPSAGRFSGTGCR